MATELAVVNLALAALGEKSVPDLTTSDTLTVAARKVMRWTDQAREEVLASGGWLCALEYVTLDPSDDPGDFRYAYRFRLPADALRVWHVDTAGVKWERGTYTDPGDLSTRQLIKADSSGPLDVVYVRKARFEALGPSLAAAVALKAAQYACIDVNGSAEKAKALAEMYRSKVAEAASIEAMEEGGQEPEIPDTFAGLRASCG